jgi:hypothetical protein
MVLAVVYGEHALMASTHVIFYLWGTRKQNVRKSNPYAIEEWKGNI